MLEYWSHRISETTSIPLDAHPSASFFFLFLFLDGNDISIVEGGPDEAPEYETPVPSPEVV